MIEESKCCWAHTVSSTSSDISQIWKGTSPNSLVNSSWSKFSMDLYVIRLVKAIICAHSVELVNDKSTAGLGSIPFRNWNWSSIPIPILELELKLAELTMKLELKSLELELKPVIDFFATANCYRNIYYLLVNQPFPNFSFKRGGHNLSYDWLLMQQVCLLSSWDIEPPVVWSQKTMGRVPCNLPPE